ncbi:MAG: protein-glutamate O-methyltransferase [Planctomycetes bacterium]|nr:protein-glutamate O-methyltransferase [Planctomycetota bacterium]
MVTTELTDAQFSALSRLVKQVAGINLHEGKRELVKSRLNKRLRHLGLRDFNQYIEYLAADTTAGELTAMLDAISTNLTSFFRENAHFEFLASSVLPAWGASARPLRAWSAGCSSGEEAYTLAICLQENLPKPAGRDVRILATDLSTRVLNKAAAGVYDADRLESMPAALRGRYFTPVLRDGQRCFQVSDGIRRMVTFGRLNLMEAWPMRGPFDLIFCRNVMIYFDKATQGALVNRFHDLLASGGLLFIGHSESLTGIQHRFRYVQPTVYRKP